jgi:hypothetical protein
MKTLSWTISAVASLALVACGQNTIGGTGTGGAGAGTTTGGAGTTTGVPSDYPVPIAPEVTGLGVGNTFPNVALSGGVLMNFATSATLDCLPKDSCSASSPNFATSFTFDDLYHAGKPAGQVNTDPTGQSVTGQGFRYAFIDISGAWCIHCKQEATDLPSKYVANWLAEGGIVFSILVQDSGGANAASQATLFSWVKQYQTNYPISIDMDENMLTTADIKAWPGNVIVRLNDMQVIESVLGAGDSFYQDFAKHLTECQNDPTIPNDCWSGATCRSSAASTTGYACVAN